jgi:hypothetical protein
MPKLCMDMRKMIGEGELGHSRQVWVHCLWLR